QPLLNPQAWESVRRRGAAAIADWIDEQMKYKKAVIVLVGQETASRPWVQYEVKKAWADKRPLLGIAIHGLSSFGSVDAAGPNPFAAAGLPASSIPLFDPTQRNYLGRIDSKETYAQLAESLVSWSTMGAV